MARPFLSKDMPFDRLEDAFELLCGEKIASGAYRDVFSFLFDKENYVVKVERGNYGFHNIGEHNVWRTYKDAPKVAKWLAPVKLISPRGLVLIQRRTRPLQCDPLKLPAFLTDRKRANYGVLDGRIVAHDYGWIIEKPDMRMTKAGMWDA